MRPSSDALGLLQIRTALHKGNVMNSKMDLPEYLGALMAACFPEEEGSKMHQEDNRSNDIFLPKDNHSLYLPGRAR